MEADRDRHRRGGHGQVRLASADPLVRPHRRRNAKVAGEIRDKRLGQVVTSGDRVVVQPRVQLRRPDLVGTVHVHHVDQAQLASGHRHLGDVRVGGCGDFGPGQVVADDVVGRHVGEHRHRDAALAVLLRRDDRGGRRPAFVDDVDEQFDRCADHHRAGEHRMSRAHRLVRKPFGHSDNRLCQHLGALHHLALVLPRDARRGSDVVRAVGLHVEQLQQAFDRPLRLR